MAEDKELANNLRQARSKVMFFAFVNKGMDGKLLVDKKKIPPKDAAEVKKALGGGTITQGRCKPVGDVLVFEVAKDPPATLLATLRKVVKRDAGLTFELDIRAASDLEEETEEDTSPEQPPSAPPPPTAAPSADKAALVKRMNAISGNIKAAMAGPNKDRVQALFVGVNGFLKSEKFAEADKSLQALEQLVKAAPTAGAAPTASVAPQGESAGNLAAALAKWEQARATVVQQMQSLRAAIEASNHGQADAALIELKAIQANLTARPDNLAKVDSLIHYLETDDVVADADAPNAFGVAIDIQVPLLEALDELKACMTA
jgi:hypothetical protein